MKKLFALLLMISFSVPAFSADQWDESRPAGSSNAADIDTTLQTNNEAIDRLLINFKRGLGVNYSTASALSALPGEIAIPNSGGTTIKWRRVTTATSIGWSDIDTGVEANSTSYNVFVTADTDITGVVFKISTSAAPSGSTYYRKIATFYNNSSGNIENVISLREDDGTDYQDIVKGWLNYNGVTNTINDSYNVSSVTDNGTGDYTVNWTTSFSSADYVVSGMVKYDEAGGLPAGDVGLSRSASSQTAASVRVVTGTSTTAADMNRVYIIAIGDRV